MAAHEARIEVSRGRVSGRASGLTAGISVTLS